MNINDNECASSLENPLTLLPKQRSHNLYLFCNAMPAQNEAFLEWFMTKQHKFAAGLDKVLSTHHYEIEDFCMVPELSKPCDYRYLAVYELSLDGAEEAADLIDQITALHKGQSSADKPAIWLYYPVSEKVGRCPVGEDQLMTLAFGNAVPGTEEEFREWYTTEHIRHALNVPTLVSGQRFELSRFQKSGGTEPSYESVAIYEQEGTVEALRAGLPSIDPETIPPSASLDLSRFSEWTYKPLATF